MDEKTYRTSEGISRSELWLIKDSPEKFKYFQEHPEPETPALIFGRLAHKLLLEPDGFDAEFAIAPDVDRRTKDGKAAYNAFLADVGGRDIVSLDDYIKAAEMAQKARRTKFVPRLLEGDHEVPFRWVDELTGELCKVRLDCIADVGGKKVIVDYKTAQDASTDAFMRAATNYGYDFQAAMYCEAVKQVTGFEPLFAFIVQEKNPPYAVNIFQADPLFLKRGYDIFRELIGIYHDCKINDNWYGYLGAYGLVNSLGLPAWLARELETDEI